MPRQRAEQSKAFVLLVTIAVSGCGPVGGEGDRSSQVDPLGVQITGKTQGSSDWAEMQSETAINVSAWLDGTMKVTAVFNDTDNGLSEYDFIQYTSTTRHIYHGASEFAWAYSTDRGTSWSYFPRLVTPPTGWAVLWGDPAIASSPLCASMGETAGSLPISVESEKPAHA